MNTIITKRIEFDAGHRVPSHSGKCRSPHGHRYAVEVGLSGPIISAGSASGMVVDFSEFKVMLVELVHDRYDHAFMVYEHDPLRGYLEQFAKYDAEHLRHKGAPPVKIVVTEFVPTAENLAISIYKSLLVHAHSMGVTVEFVRVFETPTSSAIADARGLGRNG